jgi:hypothetical protein
MPRWDGYASGRQRVTAECIGCGQVVEVDRDLAWIEGLRLVCDCGCCELDELEDGAPVYGASVAWPVLAWAPSPAVVEGAGR